MSSAVITTGAVKARRPFYKDLSVQILIATLLGIIVGYLWPAGADSLKLLGDLFIKLVRMLVAPIIFCTIVHGIASVGEAKRVGRVAVKALAYFELVTLAALVVGLVMVNLWSPGADMHVDASTLSGKAVASVIGPAKNMGFEDFLLDIVPTSAVGAFAEGNVLQVVFFSVLFGFALSALGQRAQPMIKGIETVSGVLFKMVGMIMIVSPIGAFGAIAFTVGKFGPESLIALGKLVAEFYLCCAIFIVLVMAPVARLWGFNLFRLIGYFGAELLTVFGTSSAETVFPRMITKLRALGCDETVVALVLPTGYAFNHGGTCLYYATATVFLAQAVGIHLTLNQELGLLAIMLITSNGGANVAGSAIVMLATTLNATGIIPVATIGLILGIHRLLSSVFVPTNVLGNALATLIVARSEKALNVTMFETELYRDKTLELATE